MITIKSNIAFLTDFNAWRKNISDSKRIPQPSFDEIILHIDFAIQSLAMLEQMIIDVATGKLVENDRWMQGKKKAVKEDEQGGYVFIGKDGTDVYKEMIAAIRGLPTAETSDRAVISNPVKPTQPELRK